MSFVGGFIKVLTLKFLGHHPYMSYPTHEKPQEIWLMYKEYT